MQKKLPTINSAHGSETRNIINELIKLFNNMGYSYNESLQKAHDILDEAQQTNDMNKDVQKQINNLILSDGESDAEVIQARGGHPLLKDRLDENDMEMAQTAKKYDVFSMANMGQDIKEAMTGGNIAVIGRYSVGEENLVKSAVQPEHTSFLKLGKNLFNKKDVTPSHTVSVITGVAQPSEWHDLSGYIPVSPNIKYSRKFNSIVAYFTAERTFISGVSNSGLTFTTPSNCHFIRVTTDSAGNKKEAEQIELGGTSTEYEEFSVSLGSELNKVVLSRKNFTDRIITDDMLDFNAVKIDHVDFIIRLPNLIDKSKINYSKVPSQTGLVDSNWYDASDYIEVVKGETYTFSRGIHYVQLYDINKKFIKVITLESHENTPFTFTADTDGLILAAWYKSVTDEIVMNIGDTADTRQSEFGYVLDQDLIKNVGAGSSESGLDEFLTTENEAWEVI